MIVSYLLPTGSDGMLLNLFSYSKVQTLAPVYLVKQYPNEQLVRHIIIEQHIPIYGSLPLPFHDLTLFLQNSMKVGVEV